MLAKFILPAIIRTHKQTSLTTYASVVKLVDTSDSKSDAFKSVSVRVRPLVPYHCLSVFKQVENPR